MRKAALVAGAEERKAENEAIFRDANEAIAAARAELALIDGGTPFLCECEDAGCRELLRLELGEYEEVRRNSTAFLIAPGHPSSGEVVAEHDSYLVVEKSGTAARVATETDPRADRRPEGG
jgi:hypothetical protein